MHQFLLARFRPSLHDLQTERLSVTGQEQTEGNEIIKNAPNLPFEQSNVPAPNAASHPS